jgi:DNA polymerase III epsilon subunit-like protein
MGKGPCFLVFVIVFAMHAVGLDFETDGLHDDCQITEIGAAACDLDNPERPWSFFEQLVSVSTALSEETQNLTGITPQMLRGHPTFERAWVAFSTWLELVCDDGLPVTLVTHNGFHFDFMRMGKALARRGINVEEWVRRHRIVAHVDFKPIAVDSLVCRTFRLGDVYTRIFGQPFQGAHRAKADAIAVLQAYVRFREMRKNHPQAALDLALPCVEHSLGLLTRRSKGKTFLNVDAVFRDVTHCDVEPFTVNGVKVHPRMRSPFGALYRKRRRDDAPRQETAAAQHVGLLLLGSAAEKDAAAEEPKRQRASDLDIKSTS